MATAAVIAALAGVGGGVAEGAAIPSQGVVAVEAEPTASDTALKSSATPADTTPESSATSGSPGAEAAFQPLAAAASAGPAPSILPGLNQLGLGWTSGLPYPTDQFGAIGPEHYVQGVTNTGVGVFRRSDLAMVAGPMPAGNFAGAPAGAEVVDTQMMWDSQSNRWYYAFTWKKWTNNVRTAGLLYGWSKTADPTDLAHGWCQLKIDGGNDFDDRPKLGDNATHLIMATNADPATGADYDRVFTMPKPANGSTTCPASQTGIKIFGSVSQPLKTSDGGIVDSAIVAQDNDGAANGWIVAADDRAASDSQVMLWHVNSNGDLVADGNINVSPYSVPPAAPQPSPNQPLDPVDQRLNSAIADTDPDVGATAVWASHTIADPAGTGRSVVRWYEIVPSACAPVTAGVCSSGARRQQGEVKDGSNWLFNAAMAPTDSGNEAVLHYNSASASQLVQVRARSRVSNTPLGSLGDEVVVETSDAAYEEPTCHDTRPYCRWGDYSAATTDPNDPHAVWGSNQAASPTNGGKPNWKTRNFAIQPGPSASLVHSATGAVDASPGGDGDGIVEPGESIDITETVRNTGGAAASGVSATLASNTAGLSITDASAAYPNIGAGGTGTNTSPFGASVASSIGCGAPLSMTVTLNTAQGRYRVPIMVPTGAPGAAVSTNATDVPKAIPDGTGSATSAVTITDPGRVADVNVSIARITHTWVGDLRIELIGPDGTTVLLADQPGGKDNGGDNLVNTVFDDEASTPLSAGSAPYTGTFRPQGRLGAFDGKQTNGAWTLKVSDVATDDSGSIVGWGTRLSAAACDIASNAPPSAAFTVAPQPASTGQTVTFTSTSSDPDGTVASQAWDTDNDGTFDDGTGGAASRSFATAGTYTVRLRVTDNRGLSSIASKTVTIDNRPPVASFTASPDPAPTGQSVTFTSSSTDPDGTVSAFAWDLDNDGAFDDGTAGSASRSFAKAGGYTVRLRVTDDGGQTAIATRTVTIDNRAPAAAFGFAPAAPSTGQTVTFTSSSSDPDGTVASVAWDLDDDGSYDDGASGAVSRSFAKAGSYNVKLRVTDDNGGTDTLAKSVTVANRPPVAAFESSPASPSTGQTVTFTSSSSDPDGTIASVAWDTDDDGAFDDTASRSFAKAGTYTVRLRVTDDDGASSTGSKSITVANRPPVAAFGFSPATPSTGETVTFTSSSSDPDGTITSVAWDTDDDGAFDDTASRSFAKAGTYNVKLKVTDDDGASATLSKPVVIANRGPVAAFSFAPASPSTGQTVTFTSSSSDPDGTIASVAWDTDDDGAFDDTASRSFAKAGSYNVRLKVTDDNGGTDTLAKTVAVANRPPVAAFGFAPAAPSTGQTVTFTSSSSDPDGTIASVAWDTDDDGAFDDTASRSFAKAGTYTVRVRVTDDDGASSTGSKSVTVANRPPVASFSMSPAAPVTGQTVTFSSSSTDPDGTIASVTWDTDDDGAFDDTASRSFAKAGSYTVRLRVTDDNGGTDTLAKTVTVANRPPVAAFSFSPAAPSTGQTVTFTSSSSDPDGTIASTAWDTDDDGAFDDTASRSFAKAGTYTVRLKVTDDNGGTDTLAKNVTVANRNPLARFTISPNPTSTNQAVTFESTSSDPDGTIASYAWDLDGDGQIDSGVTVASPSRSYAKAGTYPVKLIVTDDNGATATATGTVTIDNRAPAAKFSFAPASPSTLDDVTFTSESTDADGTIASQAWDLDGDGAYDDGTGVSAVRAFAKAGPHAVHLRVTDSDGVSSTATRTVTVAGRPPSASFTVDPQTVTTGQPSSFDATASSDPDGSIKSYKWDLDGNGSFETDTATTPTTSRFYAEPGNVIVGLQVTDDDGQTDVTQRTLTVTEPPPFADGPTVPPPDTQPLPGADGDPPGPGPGPDPAPQPKPHKAPRGSLRVTSHSLRTALSRGLPLRFSSSDAATAKFKVIWRSRTIGTAKKLVGAGRASLRVKLKRRPTGWVKVRMTLTGADSLSRTYSVKVRLR
jgi:PKD repeat protein